MKKQSKFTKGSQGGITLIALVVTIVVLLILAGTSIAMLTGDDGIITNAQKAQVANTEGEVIDKMGLAYSTVRTEAMVKMSTEPGYQPIEHIEELAEVAAKELGLTNAEKTEVPEKITDGYKVYYQENDSTITMLYGDNRFSLKAGSKAENNKYPNIKGVITLSTTEVVYSELPTGIENGKNDSQTKEITNLDIANAVDKNEYYGKEIKGYELPNGTTTDVGWKIFYADENNIYLIADNYVERVNLPYSTSTDGSVTSNRPNDGESNILRSAYFTNVIEDYTGSSRITDSKLKSLNNDYFTKNYSSTNKNMKAVAYMMDTVAWNSKFKDVKNKAEYVIGGPTIEMLTKSYSQKHGVNYRARAKNNVGYEISTDGGNTWENSMATNEEYLDANDSLYVIKSTTDASAMWVASPSAINNTSNILMYCNGDIDHHNYDKTNIGFRPLICLNSNVKLQKNSDGTYSIK